jgi:hypothetical protein
LPPSLLLPQLQPLPQLLLLQQGCLAAALLLALSLA